MAKAGAAHHREPLSGHRAKTPLANFGHTLREAPLHGQRGPHPRLATYRPIGSPLGRRNFGHWPHTVGSLSLAKRGAPLTAPPGRPLRLLATYATASPTGQRSGRPHREKGSHALTGPPLATYGPLTGHPGRPLTGHLRALYWPSGEASHWPKGRPRLGKGTGGGAYGHTGAPAPHFPATYGQRGATPHWPRTGHKGTAIGGRPSHRPHTGHLRPTWSSEAFGHLHPLPTPGDRDAFGREALPHSPDFRGAVAKGTGWGFRVHRGPIRCGPCALHPLWGPPPHRLTGHPTSPTDWPTKGTGLPPHWPPTPPHRLTGHPLA